MSNRPVGILLAAGKSARFGCNKLLYPVINNTPMLLVSAAKLVSVLPDSIVVINRELSALTTQLEQMGLRVVINEQAEQGMGSSIACGVRASEFTNDKSCQGASSWLIMLADMPYIKTETIMLLVDKLKDGARMIAPTFGQQRGHPVGFSQCYKKELLALNEDMGARQVLKNNQSELELVSINDEGILIDIDYSGDVL
ncbi:MAG: nucleotidyltransferase family protein [Gammaproteobacteria bacterium]|nr:nucleotidyltransferase family protein [Gammaproteobacteria bacterium]